VAYHDQVMDREHTIEVLREQLATLEASRALRTAAGARRVADRFRPGSGEGSPA
jgi:hypothetical protein